jgi:isopentenyl phosphate kinase
VKERPFTPNKEAIERLAREIKQANNEHLVLVHGGGSFGHPLAKQYALREGYKSTSQLMGFSKTHQAMVTLNKMFIDALIDHAVPAVSLQTSSCVITKSGRIHSIEKRPLMRLLKIGFVPVLYGDAVLDLDLGFSILSGDQLVTKLATLLKARGIVMGIDVDGLYSADPKIDPAAKLIQTITSQELETLKDRIGDARATDVTGGMHGKINELMPVIKQGLPVTIVNASKAGNIQKALKGEDVVGTVITRNKTVG